MRFPWFNRETRAQSSGYAEAIEQRALDVASRGPSTAEASAALEVAASMYAKAFASAVVENAPPSISAAVSASMLATIGRSLVRDGESVWCVEVQRGMLYLLPSAYYTVTGGAMPDEWAYRLSITGPTMTTSRNFAAADVLHFRYAVDPARPWLGVPPLQWAFLTGQLHGTAEAGLLVESRLPSGMFIPQEAPGSSGYAGRDNGPRRAKSRELAEQPGQLRVVPHQGTRYRRPSNAASGWQALHYGPKPESGMVNLRSETAREVLAACGIPPSLTQANSDGTAQRESYRRFLFGTIAPVAACVQDELRVKLDAPDLALNFDELFASDLTGRARAVQSLVNAGTPLELALAVARLEPGSGATTAPTAPTPAADPADPE